MASSSTTSSAVPNGVTGDKRKRDDDDDSSAPPPPPPPPSHGLDSAVYSSTGTRATQEDLDIIDAAYHQQAKRASESSRSLLTKVESTVEAAEERLETTVQVAIADVEHAVEAVEDDFLNRVDSSRRLSPAAPPAAPPPPPDVECGVVEALEMKEKKKKRRRRKEKTQRTEADAPSAQGGSSVLCGACLPSGAGDAQPPASPG